MESLLPMIIQLVAGGAGGNIAGTLLKNTSMGPLLNTVAGALGGVGGAAVLPGLLGSVLGSGDVATAASSGIGGIVLSLVAGFIKNKMMAKA